MYEVTKSRELTFYPYFLVGEDPKVLIIYPNNVHFENLVVHRLIHVLLYSIITTNNS